MDVAEEKTTFADFAEDSEFHGVKQVTRKTNGYFRRSLWVLLIFGSMGILVNNTAKQILEFLDYNHITKYDVRFVHELDFPTITLCNVNKHRRSALTIEDIVAMGPQLRFTDDQYNLLHSEDYPEEWYNQTFLNRDWQTLKEEFTGRYFDMEDFFNRTGHQQQTLIQMCTWKTGACSDSSWTTEYTHYGKCYTFNRNGDHVLKKAGAGNGLQLILYDEEEEYIHTKHSEDLGIRFLAHSHIEPPFLKELGSGLAPGFHYLIAMQETELKSLPHPYGDCVRDRTTLYYPNYTLPACRIECETESIYEKCGCRLVESPGTYPICDADQFDCADQQLEFIEDSDECLCQNPCHTKVYTYSLSMLRLRQSTIDKLRSDHPIPAHLDTSSLMVVNIFYDKLAYERIEQVKAYTWMSVLSDFGGSVGLWLGASLLSLFQLFDFMLMKCSQGCKCRSVGQKTTRDHTRENQSSQKTTVKSYPSDSVVAIHYHNSTSKHNSLLRFK